MRFRLVYEGSRWPFIFLPAGLACFEAAILADIPHVSWFVPPIVASLTLCVSLGYYLWWFPHSFYFEVNQKGVRRVLPLLGMTFRYERLVAVELSLSGQVKFRVQHAPVVLKHLPPERHHYEVTDRLADPRSFETALRLHAPAHVEISWVSPSLEEAYVFEAPGGFRRRAIAFAVDSVWAAFLGWIACAVLLMPLWVAGIEVEEAAWLALVLPLVSWFLYTWEGNARGHSDSKRLMKLKVQALSGAAPGCWRGLWRTVGQLAIGLTFGVGYLWVFTNRERRGLHDMLAGTRVVRSVKRQAPDSQQVAADLAPHRQAASSS